MGRVWVIEDDLALRKTYARWLSVPPRGLDVRTFAAPGEVEYAVSADAAPDGLILDQQLPGECGLDWFARRSEYLRSTLVYLVTGHADASLSHQAHRLGIALLIKPMPFRFFSQFATAVRVRALARRAHALTDRQAVRVASDSARWSLSERQTEVLSLFVRGLQTKEVAVELGLSAETVKKHIHAILERAQRPTMAALLREIWTDST